MGKATVTKELVVKGTNTSGQLAKLTGPIAEAKVNVTALCAVGQGGDAWYWLVTDNNATARDALTKAGWSVTEKDCCCVELTDRPGTCWETATTLANAGINLDHWYYSCCGAPTAKAYFSCDNCQKAVSTLG